MDVPLEPIASKFSAQVTLWWTLKYKSLISGKTGAGTHRVGFRVVPGCFEEEKKISSSCQESNQLFWSSSSKLLIVTPYTEKNHAK